MHTHNALRVNVGTFLVVGLSISRYSIVHFSRHFIVHFSSLDCPFLSSLHHSFLVAPLRSIIHPRSIVHPRSVAILGLRIDGC